MTSQNNKTVIGCRLLPRSLENNTTAKRREVHEQTLNCVTD